MEDSQAKKQKTKHNATLGSNFKIFYFMIIVNKIVIKKNKKIKILMTWLNTSICDVINMVMIWHTI